jgi:hypothetical protein
MRESVTDLAAIAAEIARIRALSPDALGRCWRAVFGRKPPAGLSRELLGRMIAMGYRNRPSGVLIATAWRSWTALPATPHSVARHDLLTRAQFFSFSASTTPRGSAISLNTKLLRSAWEALRGPQVAPCPQRIRAAAVSGGLDPRPHRRRAFWLGDWTSFLFRFRIGCRHLAARQTKPPADLGCRCGGLSIFLFFVYLSSIAGT